MDRTQLAVMALLYGLIDPLTDPDNPLIINVLTIKRCQDYSPQRLSFLPARANE